MRKTNRRTSSGETSDIQNSFQTLISYGKETVTPCQQGIFCQKKLYKEVKLRNSTQEITDNL